MKNIINNIKLSLIVLGLVSSFAAIGFAPSVSAAPVDVIKNSCDQQATSNSALCSGNDQKLFGADSLFTKIINTIIFVVGSVAVIMIVIGGLKYVLSAGDSSAVSSAKNTILYAVIGIAIAVSAYAIVNFVLAKI